MSRKVTKSKIVLILLRSEGDLQALLAENVDEVDEVGMGRWKAFENFKRIDSTKVVLLKGGTKGILKDFLPGLCVLGTV